MSTNPIKAARKQKGLSQAKLGEVVGVDRLTILRWELGRRRPEGDNLRRLSLALGVPKRELRPDLVELLEEPA